MLEGLVQDMDLSSGLALVISSPGGYPLAAEKIIRICKSYSGTGTFVALVPGAAKSAATMICLGADRIAMGPSSELGPVDPQVLKDDDGNERPLSVTNILNSYDKLFKAATSAKGNLQPYLQQLAAYDPMEVEEMRSAIALSEDISVKALASGMMVGQKEESIRTKITTFIEPRVKKVHGRAIYREEARKCGLTIEDWEVGTERWEALYELYLRTRSVVNNEAAKAVETAQDGWYIGYGN